MPVYQLIDDLVFPPPDHAEPEGLLAVGGDLRIERLLLAYRMGIFPWYSDGQPILWWSPDPRLILEPDSLRISRRLRQTVNRGRFHVTFDSAFRDVIHACATVPRRHGPGTWITSEMERAYIALHHAGYAHSAEGWIEGKLAGGVYGVSLGRCFFGESMFHLKTDASKVALLTLARQLGAWNFHMIDAQIPSPHLISLGAMNIPRKEFLKRLEKALEFPTRKGRWVLEIF
jgi:leucyl/phenylalanyl-tRNA--protein transferase